MTAAAPIVNGARRVTIYRDNAGEWRYKAQASNWRIIDAAEEGLSKRTCRARVAKRYPGVEVIELAPVGGKG